jgi:Rrf2 family protein
MGRRLNLSQAGEYAVASLSRLALCFPRPVAVQDLARAQGIPRPFLAKILGRCAKAGIVRSKTGPSGGMTLARDPGSITLLSVVQACEGDFQRSLCVFYGERVCDGPACRIYCPLRRTEENLRSDLGAATLADMSRSLKDHPLNQGGRAWTQRLPA